MRAIDFREHPVKANISVLGLAGLLSLGVFLAMEHFAPLTQAACVTALIAIVLAVAVWCFRQIDEAAREAHKTAWLWGGLSAMAPSLGLLTYMLRSGQTAWAHTLLSSHGLHADPQVAALAMGVVFCLLAQGVGYAIFWVFWWLARR